MYIFKSRKFWLMVSDIVISLVIYFVTKYSNPVAAEDVVKVIGLIQPVVIAVILGIALEDSAEKNARIYTVEEKEVEG